MYNAKTTKFGLEKYANGQNIEEININKIENKENELLKENIANKWLIQKGNNCRYNAFITLFYFTITPYINENRDKKYLLLDELNEKIIKFLKI